MRRLMLFPLASLALLNVVGCHLVMGKCDCDKHTILPGCVTVGDGSALVVPAAVKPPVTPEPIKEPPRPDKED